MYCREEGTGAFWSRDHVMPQAFGRFRNNFVLRRGVCAACNHHFGATIERVFARGSLEALRRLQFHMKTPRDVRHLLRSRIRLTWDVPGHWHGAVLELREEDGEIVAGLVPQVGFARRGAEGFVYLSDEELRDQRPLPPEADPTRLHLLSDTERNKTALIAVLAQRGIPFQEQHDTTPPVPEHREIVVDVQTAVDALLHRAVAKIAFNYLAYTQGPDFALNENFERVRRFIRYGTPPGYRLVRLLGRPILATDRPRRRHTQGHIVVLYWTADRNHLVANVSPFNEVTYSIILATHFRGLWHEIRSGHHFDLDTRDITPLRSIPTLIVQRRRPV
jgi:hypothetical protein